MGAAASVLSTIDEKNGVSDDCTTFISYFLSFCPLNPQGKTLRKAAWRVIDVNGNGYVSLAETGKWIKELLETQMVKEAEPASKGKGGKTGKQHASSAQVKDAQDSSKLLYKRFYPCYIRAFLDAADIGKNGKVGGTKTATKDDYVQRHEFRFLCCYLCIYALMYDAFSVVDGGGAEITKDDDRRISLAELKKAAGKFAGHPLLGAAQLGMPEKYGNVESVFMEMDADGKGMVLLSEWCAYLEKKEAENATKFGKLLLKNEHDDD
jgi:Ca2+-binding EF-hand superfamily protein